MNGFENKFKPKTYTLQVAFPDILKQSYCVNVLFKTYKDIN